MDCSQSEFMNHLKAFQEYKNQNKKEKYKISIIIIFLLYLIVLLLGSLIFMFLFNLTWINAVYVATLIMTGIDLEVTVTTTGEKIFIIIFSIISVILLLSMANVALQYLFEFI